MSDALVWRSAVASLVVQSVTGIVTVIGLATAPAGLVEVLLLEVVSQIIEFVWYVVAVVRFRDISTWTRYIDWVFSTPVMLTSTALFFLHRGDVALDRLLHDATYYRMLAFNWLMLAFGLAAEVGAAETRLSVALGTAAFVVSFQGLASFIPSGDDTSIGLFCAMAVVWALYGVAALLGHGAKNVGYNALDVVSKNFYGIFLTIYASNRS